MKNTDRVIATCTMIQIHAQTANESNQNIERQEPQTESIVLNARGKNIANITIGIVLHNRIAHTRDDGKKRLSTLV